MRFVPRVITPAAAAGGYNNKGRGKLLGYISDPMQHEVSCPWRKSNGKKGTVCACRIGLWQETPKTKKTRARSSVDGEFVKPEFAKKHPRTTTVEKIKPKARRRRA